jgi:ketosteroid isomerase-like protein
MTLSRSVLLNTANSFLSAYNKWTVPSVLSIRSNSCVHRTLPASGGHPHRNNAEFGAFLEDVIPVFRNFHLSVVDDKHTIIDVETRQVMLHLRGRAETDAGPYENEYIFMLTISEDGEKVDEIVEFLDSEYTSQFVKKLPV